MPSYTVLYRTAKCHSLEFVTGCPRLRELYFSNAKSLNVCTTHVSPFPLRWAHRYRTVCATSGNNCSGNPLNERSGQYVGLASTAMKGFTSIVFGRKNHSLLSFTFFFCRPQRHILDGSKAIKCRGSNSRKKTPCCFLPTTYVTQYNICV